MDYSSAEKEAVYEAFERKLDDLDAADREPDRREEECLALAIAAMTCGRYRVASAEVIKVSAAEHARYQEIVDGLVETLPRLTKEDFRRGLATLRPLVPERK